MGGPHCDADVRTQPGVGILHHDHHITVGLVHILCQRVDQTQVLQSIIGVYDEKIKEKAYIITSWQVQETIQKTRVASTKSFIKTGKLYPSR